MPYNGRRRARRNTVEKKAARSREIYKRILGATVNRIYNRNAEYPSNNIDKTPLVFAILYEQFEIAQQLVALGDNVGVRNALGQTALQYAVTPALDDPSDMSSTNMIHGKNLSVYGRNKLDYKMSCNIDLSARDLTIMKQAAAQREGKAFDRAGRLSLVKVLLNAGANVNNRDHGAVFPIHSAVYTGDVELVKTLIDAGADTRYVNEMSVTPLHIAVCHSNEAMIHLLLSHGAWSCLNVKTLGGNTPLHWAALLDRENSSAPAIIKMLLDYPVDVNSRNAEDRTPFHYIMCNFAHDSDVLGRFMELKVDVNAKDIIGATPLSLNEQNLLDPKLPVLPANVEERSLIIAHVAAIEAKTGNPVFDDYNLTVINGNSETKSYYEKCRAELEAMKQWKIKDTSFTYFNILTEKLEMLVRHGTKNKELLKLVLEELQNSDYQTVYPIYGSWLRAKLDATVAKRKMIEDRFRKRT